MDRATPKQQRYILDLIEEAGLQLEVDVYVLEATDGRTDDLDELTKAEASTLIYIVKEALGRD